MALDTIAATRNSDLGAVVTDAHERYRTARPRNAALHEVARLRQHRHPAGPSEVP